MIVNESNMNFIIDEDNCYRIENDYFYNDISSKYGVKDVDFILLKENKIIFIEAKTSAPRDLSEYNKDIKTKFIDSLMTFIAVLYKKQNTTPSNISNSLNKTTHLSKSIKFILIIKNIEKRHLAPIKDNLNRILKKEKRIFAIESIIVLNENMAKSKSFVE